MRVALQKFISDATGTPISSQTFPWVTQTPSGRILVMFRGGRWKGPTNEDENGWYCYSDDGGETFSAPEAPFQAIPLGNGDTGFIRSFLLLPLGGKRVFLTATVVTGRERSKPYFNEATEGLKDSRLMTAFSQDDGTTFGPLRELPMTAQFAGLCSVLTGPPLLLSDGRIMVNFEIYKPYDDTRPIDHKAGCIFSADSGETFGPEVTLFESSEVYAWDHRAVEASPGVLEDFVWTFDRRTNNYRNIGRIESLDGGATWSGIEDTGLPGQAGNAVMLPDGRLALIYIDRTGAPTVRLALSRDHGRTWEENLALYVHGTQRAEHQKSAYGEAWTEMGKFTAGHPFLTRLNNGQLLAVHYAGPAKDRTDLMLTWIDV